MVGGQCKQIVSDNVALVNVVVITVVDKLVGVKRILVLSGLAAPV